MNEVAQSGRGRSEALGDHAVRYYKKDFWAEENLKYARPHHRLEKSARIVNKLARGRECSLLDVGCGPATLMRLISSKINYYGIDIAIQQSAPNLMEADFLKTPIRFDDKKFDIIVAQGFFEYIGEFQSKKFAEVASILKDNGTFLVSYVNFGHRARAVYWPYSNVRPLSEFRASLERHFIVQRQLPTSHNWKHGEPGKKLVKAANRYFDLNVPVISRKLAVEYFFICSPRR